MIKEYHAPATLEEAVRLKQQLARSAVFLAGGTEVNSAAFAGDAEHVISLERLALADIRATDAELILGARCTIQQVIDAPEAPEALKAAGRHIFNRNIRNVATIGGQIGSNQSCGNLLPILVALEAVVDIAAADSIPVQQYLSQERHELITHVRIPRSEPARRFAVERQSRTANDASIVTAAVCLTREGKTIVNPIIAAGGVAKHVIRLESVEDALRDKPPPRREALERLTALHVSPISDLRGSAEFRRKLAGVLVAKAVMRAYLEEAGSVP